MTDKLKLAKPVRVMQPTSYHFVFKPMGWAIFTINDDTGEFNINSDWGDYAHRWSPHPDHLGAPNLTAFLVERGSAHYIADKLHYTRKKDEYDGDATVKEVRRLIAQKRRDGTILSEKARQLWDDASCLGEVNHEEAQRIVEDHAPELHEFLGYEVWEHFVYRPTYRYTFLVEQLLPFFLQWLRDNVAQKRSA